MGELSPVNRAYAESDLKHIAEKEGPGMDMLDINCLLRSSRDVDPEIVSLAREFAGAAGAKRRYALGRNEHAEALSQTVELTGIVDDFAERGTTWRGKPVLKATELPADAIAVNCSMCTSPVSAARRLSQLNIAGVLSFADLCRALPDRFRLPAFILETRRDIDLHAREWEQLSRSLADRESRQVLHDVLRFRASGDYGVMSGYSVRPTDQYFEQFLGLSDGEVFVDAGGFDGDTTEEFCRRYPGYRKVLLFEPSATNMERARNRLRKLRDVEFFEMGLSDVPGHLSFNPDAGSASAIGGSYSHRVRTTTLDLEVQERVSFIKMDLEGWERKALEGTRYHIMQDAPRLAIAVYHSSLDFRRIFQFVVCLRSAYRVYLRHYTEGWSETVMYFVPEPEHGGGEG